MIHQFRVPGGYKGKAKSCIGASGTVRYRVPRYRQYRYILLYVLVSYFSNTSTLLVHLYAKIC
jgi:hypothetical protein